MAAHNFSTPASTTIAAPSDFSYVTTRAQEAFESISDLSTLVLIAAQDPARDQHAPVIARALESIKHIATVTADEIALAAEAAEPATAA